MFLIGEAKRHLEPTHSPVASDGSPLRGREASSPLSKGPSSSGHNSRFCWVAMTPHQNFISKATMLDFFHFLTTRYFSGVPVVSAFHPVYSQPSSALLMWQVGAGKINWLKHG